MENNNKVILFGFGIISLIILLSVFFINTTYIANDNLNVSIGNIGNINLSYKNYVDSQDIIFNDSMTYYTNNTFLKLIGENSANVQVTSITASDFLKITPRATPPTAQEGVFYYDSDLHEPCYYNSTQWVGISSGGVCS